MIPSPHPEEVLDMLSETRGTPVYSPAPGVIPDTITGPVTNGSSVATDPEVAPAPAAAATANASETRGQHFRRKAHRTRLHGYAIVAVALVAFLIALAASNTAHVKVNWVFGNSNVSLVWLVLFAAILGWLLGLVATAAFHWRTRAPRRDGGTS
jgi:uncharacterized integral membrane protein